MVKRVLREQEMMANRNTCSCCAPVTLPVELECYGITN